MSFLTHPFFLLAMSLRPEELPIDQRKHIKNAPRPISPAVLPKLVQTFETPEPPDTTDWPVCYKCDRPFSTELALRHHLASVFHHTKAHTTAAEDVPASEESLACEICVDRKVFKSALALRMHAVNGNHTRQVYKAPEEVEALPASGWGKPMTSPNFPVKEISAEDTRVEEALRRIAEEIGKTKRVNFSDAMLAEIDTEVEETQVLILSATRDLALLVHTLLATRCANFGITTYACVGGTAIQDDKISLSEGPHIVSGTPGRVCDMIRRRALRTDGILLLVLNKEEMLLNRSMWPQLAAVYGLLDVDTKVVRASVRVREGTV
ncbi:uncharacterized protein LAJ45_04633 [Morchella importuna]|uniref:uncharacterized protein n=1 Tax=Morchella importuna TaxID=1174673 RepID=UPI001E8D6BDB|nr:uncharacterized protein LAJ45_04633 [Morchella importuna]KAH8151428.1 hypothetical protein LAJ45_04633 [Morchella importuna]